MYDTILIPVDGSKDSTEGAEHGVGLAAALGATVHAFHVIKEGTNPWSSASLDDQLDVAMAHGEEITDEVADMAAEAGVDCVAETVVGPRVYEEINEYVEEEGIDAIVMGSGYRGSIGGILGSTADRVLRSAIVPVTVVRRTG